MTASPYERYERLVVPALGAPFVDAMTEPLRDAPPGPILDVGCGTGATARAVAQRLPGRRVVATDADHVAVRFARAHAAGGAWLTTGVAALALRAATVAGVVCQQAAQFFPDAGAACRELARVTKPGGVIVVLSWTPDGAPLFAHLDDALLQSGAGTTPQYARPLAFDVEVWTRAASAARLSTQSVEHIAAPLVVADTRALVEHFIEPTDDVRVAAVELAMSTLSPAIAAGMTLTAVRVVHRVVA